MLSAVLEVVVSVFHLFCAERERPTGPARTAPGPVSYTFEPSHGALTVGSSHGLNALAMPERLPEANEHVNARVEANDETCTSAVGALSPDASPQTPPRPSSWHRDLNGDSLDKRTIHVKS